MPFGDPSTPFFSYTSPAGHKLICRMLDQNVTGGQFEVIAGGIKGEQAGVYWATSQKLGIFVNDSRTMTGFITDARSALEKVNSVVYCITESLTLTLDQLGTDVPHSVIYPGWFEMYPAPDRQTQLETERAEIAGFADIAYDDEPDYDDDYAAERIALNRAYAQI